MWLDKVKPILFNACLLLTVRESFTSHASGDIIHHMISFIVYLSFSQVAVCVRLMRPAVIGPGGEALGHVCDITQRPKGFSGMLEFAYKHLCYPNNNSSAL